MDNIPNGSGEFVIEQFRQLHEEIRSLNRFAWQLPLGVLGAVGLCLGGLNVLGKSLDSISLVVPLGLIAMGIITFSFVFLLARFHVRRDFRREEARKIQNWFQQRKDNVLFAETLPRSCEITQYATDPERGGKEAINRVFGRWETTAFGIVLLSLVAVLLIVAGIVVAFSSCK